MQSFSFIISLIVAMGILFYCLFKLTRYAFFINLLLIFITIAVFYHFDDSIYNLVRYLLYIICPLLLINTVLYVFLHKSNQYQNPDDKYQVHFKTVGKKFKINNVKRGASIIGSAGSGKTESVVFNFLNHFSKHSFCGLIHDYKDFEITEMAYPLFEKNGIEFRAISFDQIFDRVNPIYPNICRMKKA